LSTITRKKTIILVSPNSQYGVSQYFVIDLSAELKKLGFNVLIVSPTVFNKKLTTFLADSTLYFIFGMNGWGFESLSKHILNKTLNVPFIAYLLDHPLYHSNRIDFNISSNRFIVSCVDLNHLKDLETFFKGNFQTAFIPQGAKLPSNLLKNRLPMEKRPIPLLFAGSYMDENLYRKEWNNHILSKVFDEISERAIYQNKDSVLLTANQVFAEKGLPFGIPEDKVLIYYLNQIDLFIRAKRRREVLETVAPLNITIYNEKWSYLKKLGALVKPSINYAELLRILSQTKITLNILPNYVYGGHERIFNSLLSGSVCFSDRNEFLDNNFQNKREILLYNLNNTKMITDTLTYYLNQNNLLANIVRNGQQKVMKEHTWRQRAKTLLKEVGKNYTLPIQ